MPAEKKWRHPVHKTLNFETDRYKEFQDICWRERKSVSEKLDEMITEIIEKKVVGDENPINVLYGTQKEKEILSQSDLRQWFAIVDTAESHKTLGMYKGQALEIARRADKRSMELRKNGITR